MWVMKNFMTFNVRSYDNYNSRGLLGCVALGGEVRYAKRCNSISVSVLEM